MEQDLKGKTAVVTGSTSGIGLAIAKEFLERGANVMFNGIFTDSKDKSAEQARNEFHRDIFEPLQKQYAKQRIQFMEADITKDKEVQKLMDYAAETAGDGKIDILVNNAGVQRPHAIGTLTPADWRAVIDANLTGAFLCTHYALPYLKAAKGANIINMGSVHAHVVSHERAAYCASKFGLNALTQVSAVDLAQDKIQVNMIAPAFVKTPLAEMQITERVEKLGETREQAETWRLQHQDGQWIELKELGKAAADLCSGKLSVPSGESYIMDNGYIEKARQTGGVAYFAPSWQADVSRLHADQVARSGTPDPKATHGGISVSRLAPDMDHLRPVG